jgi:hypothetical protein
VQGLLSPILERIADKFCNRRLVFALSAKISKHRQEERTAFVLR